jgi:serine/threonine protein kinase
MSLDFKEETLPSRILSQNQNRKHKIHSVVTTELLEYVFENDFEIDDSLQEGKYGIILHGIDKKTGKDVVLKKMKRYVKNEIIRSDIIKEIAFLQLLNKYPQTMAVTFYGVAFTEDYEDMYLVLESLEKSLWDIKSNISPQQIKIILYQIINAFYFIHGLGIIHNDIKLGNVMIKNNHIRIIDFGISEFLSVGPAAELISDYMCTEQTKAPDSIDQLNYGYIPTNRKSYVSDMFSIGCSIIHLVTKEKTKKVIVVNNKIYLEEKDSTEKSLLVNKQMFDPDCYDLLLKIMNPDTHLRWCAIQALSHPYFADILSIDREIILDGGGLELFYEEQVQYNLEEFSKQQMEICFLEIQHQTYIDDKIPLFTCDEHMINSYFTIMDWIFSIFFKTPIITGFDSLINNICLMQGSFKRIFNRHNRPSTELQMLGILPTHISRCIFNHSELDLNTYSEISGNSFDTPQAVNFILNDLMRTNNFKLPIYPISVHIQYIFLNLKYVLKDARIQTEEILKIIFINICLHLIYWLIQPEPFQCSDLTIWEMIIFCTNRTLSLILRINLYELNQKPMLYFLTLDDNKCIEINKYYETRLKLFFPEKFKYLNAIFDDLRTK